MCLNYEYFYIPTLIFERNNLKFVISNNPAILIYLLQFSYPQTAFCFMSVKLKWEKRGKASDGGHGHPWTPVAPPLLNGKL